ncbi:MAG TPA: proline dehydrogenase family protein [Streptosporangiaceae bacterium]|nr:proline dehydrogenase family protein [Streptosporangiaceae bacterium]
MLRRALLAASASTRVRELTTTMPVTRDVVTRFVAGDTADQALEVVERLLGDGLLATIDYLGEYTTDRDQAAAVADEYIRLLGRLGAAGLSPGGRAEVSVKPTAVGLGLPDHGEKTALENIVRIAVAARNAGTTVTLDMEDHTLVDATLRLVAELRADFPDLGCVIQSYLRRSPADCQALATAGSRVRLCKGAYQAPDDVALSARHDVDRSYARCMRMLLEGSGYPMLATHDPRLIELAGVKATMAGREHSEFEYQLLYGMRPAEQRRLVARGARVRVYVPYGSDWYGYLVRRLAERPANLAFFLRALIPMGR